MARIDLEKKIFARNLRRNQTDAERKLWYLLRDQLGHQHKFRRQRVIGPYIVDFCCIEAKLIVELDGSQHMDNMAEDQARTEYLEKEGFTVVRFWNDLVMRSPDDVMKCIFNALSHDL